ncbi:hypothetical protein YQE_09646, partial [Dendroctonus ponderosae]
MFQTNDPDFEEEYSVKGIQTAAYLHPLLNRKNALSIHNKTLMYKQVIRVQLCYGAPVISQTCKTNIKKLQTFQNKLRRRISRAPWYVRNSQIHKNLIMETIQEFISKLHKKFKTKILDHTNPNPRDFFPNNPKTPLHISQ